MPLVIPNMIIPYPLPPLECTRVSPFLMEVHTHFSGSNADSLKEQFIVEDDDDVIDVSLIFVVAVLLVAASVVLSSSTCVVDDCNERN